MVTIMSERNTQTHQVTTTNRARAGVTGHHVRAVLVISTAAVVILFGGILLMYFA